jgi:L,D-transpeptidase ErfK/SrfK
VYARQLSASVTQALAAAALLCLTSQHADAQVAAQTQVFVIHGIPKTCIAIVQLDSALSSDYQKFFAGWAEKDYADAVAWSQACSEYGWHVPGRPRISLLQAQHDRALGSTHTPVASSTATTFALPSPPATVAAVGTDVPAPAKTALSAATIAVLPSATRTEPAHATVFELPANGSPVIGVNATITSHYQDTLLDIARRYNLGFEEIVRANPDVDLWLPGEGTSILLPAQRILPPGPREGVVVNLPEHRLYYFPKPKKNEKQRVITYPVSIGKVGRSTPLGETYVSAKVRHPYWYPPESVRKEHAERGDPLPPVVGPGPDNPLGDFMLRLAFSDGAYEIHGTNNPAAVGMGVTYGCLGMYPEDVAALFELIPVGTPVRIVNVPVKGAWLNGRLLLEAHPTIDAQGRSFDLDIDQLSDHLQAEVADIKIAILWDYAHEILRKADGVVATVGLPTKP